MISILIPIYNESVVALVQTLHEQCTKAAIPFEIICLDDGSHPEIRKLNAAALRDLPGLQYQELTENIGRSRIRNRLASLSQYPYLLFSDGDAGVVRTDFIQRYLQLLRPKQVIYGGRVYSELPPEKKDYRLHWRYGRQREALPVEARSAHPYRTFMTNNFVVPRAIFETVQFDEALRRYGYEDNLYALELQRAGVSILHIDNPLQHLGLETRAIFLRKVREALDNLQELQSRFPELDTRLLNVVHRLEVWNVLPLVRFLSPWLKPFFKSLMRIDNMPLRVLDLYKLTYFLDAKK